MALDNTGTALVAPSNPIIPTAPAVVTSAKASKELSDIQNQHADILNGINTQAAKVATDKATADATAQVKSQQDAQAAKDAAAAKVAQQQADAATAASAAKTAAVSGTGNQTGTYSLNANGDIVSSTGNTVATKGNFGTVTNTAGQALSGLDDNGNLLFTTTSATTQPSAADQLSQAQDEYQTTAKTAIDTITGIQNGSIPLTPGEQAQVDGLKAQFQQLIDQQALTNKGASGLANVRGYQKGAAEYDPTFQAKTIGAIVSAGAAKIADLNTKMASAVAQLTQSFKDNDIAKIKDTWALYKDASKERTDALQKTIDDTQKAIKDAQDAKIAADKVQYDEVTKPIQDIATEAAKNGLTDAKLLQSIASAPDVTTAINLAGGYLQTATGDVGEYLAYSRLATSKGQVPISYMDYLSEKKTATTTPKSSGGNSSSSGNPDDISLIAQAIENGHQPPVTTGLYGKTAAVRAQLEKDGYDYTKANQDWTATQKLLATLNGAQQTRLRQAVNQVGDSLGLVQSLADQWDAGGFPILNKTTLLAAKNGVLGADAQSLATRLDAEIADITSELGTVYKGGNSSTDESLKLAAQNLSSSWSKKTFDDAVALAKQNIQIRKNSLDLTTAGITNSNYNQTTANLLTQGAQSDANLTQNLTKLKTTNPKLYDAASSMYTSINPDTGQPYTAEDIYQAFPELHQ